jgi:hypothetical protein
MIVVKHNYISARDRQSQVGGKPSKVAAVGRALAHLKYIQHRPGEDREKGGREFFNESDDELSARRLRKAVKEMKDSKVVVHKITLAPEINPEDKKAFTREVMQKLGSEKGLDLQWMAVEHNNTDHHHIHVVILGKDKNGTDVRIDKKDYSKIKEYGDRYLERCHPLELERSRSERERKEKERIEQRQKTKENTRQERIRDGLELPWMHKKIIREQLEPYSEWKKKPRVQREKDAAAENDKPYFQDTINAAGKDWSKQNTLAELEKLNQHLWENHDEWLEPKEYNKLVAWMHEKRELGEPGKPKKDKEADQPGKPAKEPKDYFDYKGERYSEGSSYEKLQGLSGKLREKDSERLPFEEYNQLRGWLENADRARWSGIVDRQLTAQHKKDFTKTGDQLKAMEGGRVLNPLQENIMSNPVTGLFMQFASLANTVVSWIPVLDNRDRLKEGRDALEAAKLDKHQEYVKPDRTPEQKDRDKATIDKLDQAIDDNQATRDKSNDEKKKKKKGRGEEDDPFMFDPWGQY